MTQKASTSAVGTQSAGIGSSMLAKLQADTDAALGRIQSEVSAEQLATELDQLGQQFEEASKIDDEQQRATRTRILTSTHEQIINRSNQQRADLAKAMANLDVLVLSLGDKFKQLTQPSAEEQQLIINANNAVLEAEQKLAEAKNDWYIIPGRKEAATSRAEAALEAAKSNVEVAKQQSEEMARQRLLSANFEVLFQEMQNRSLTVATVITDRARECEKELKDVSSRKLVMNKEKEQAAKQLEELRAQVQDLETRLADEEQTLAAQVKDTAEYAQWDTKVSESRRQLQVLNGTLQQVTAIFQNRERFAQNFAIQEKALILLRDNLKMCSVKITLDMQEREVSNRARLVAKKASADESIASVHDKMGEGLDRDTAEEMATIAVTSSKNAVATLQRHQGNMQEFAQIAATLAEASAQFRNDFAEIYARQAENYGIDPRALSHFSYGDSSSTPAEEQN